MNDIPCNTSECKDKTFKLFHWYGERSACLFNISCYTNDDRMTHMSLILLQHPTIPDSCEPYIADLLNRCWQKPKVDGHNEISVHIIQFSLFALPAFVDTFVFDVVNLVLV